MRNPIFHVLLAVVFAATFTTISAQTFKNLKGCAFSGTLPKGAKIDASALPGDEAQRYKDTIVSVVGIITGGEIILRAADSIKNAVATEFEGKRYILYNPDFLRQFKLGDDARWKAYSVLAHEVGHHVLKHNFSEPDCNERKKMEREADEYSGKAMRRLCANREQSLAALKSIPRNQPLGSCYPSILLRTKVVGEAWDAQDSIFKAQPKLDPCIDQVVDRQLTYVVKESIKNTNPRAHIYKDRVEFTLDIPLTTKRNKLLYTHIVVDEKAGDLLRIKSFRWKDYPLTPGSKTLVWFYKKDSLTRPQVEKLALLNVCAFRKNPAPTTPLELFGWSAMTAGGTALVVWSGITFGQSQTLYNTYQANKNPLSAQYQGTGAISRSTTKTNADNKLTLSFWGGVVGTGLLTWGVIKLIKRSQRNKRTFILIPNYPGTL